MSLGRSALCHVYWNGLFDIACNSESEAAPTVLLSYTQKILCMCPRSFFFLTSSLNKQVPAAGSRREPLWIRWSEKEGSAGAMDSRGSAPPPASSVPRTAFSVLTVCYTCFTYMMWYPFWVRFLQRGLKSTPYDKRIYIKKGKVIPLQARCGPEGLFHDRGSRRECVVSSTPRPHFTPGKDPVPILQEAGWAPRADLEGRKISLERESKKLEIGLLGAEIHAHLIST